LLGHWIQFEGFALEAQSLGFVQIGDENGRPEKFPRGHWSWSPTFDCLLARFSRFGLDGPYGWGDGKKRFYAISRPDWATFGFV